SNVRGRRRVPRPAARTIVFMGPRTLADAIRRRLDAPGLARIRCDSRIARAPVEHSTGGSVMDDTTGESVPEGARSVPISPATASVPAPSGARAPASADMMQAVTMIDRGVKERRDSDTVL